MGEDPSKAHSLQSAIYYSPKTLAKQGSFRPSCFSFCSLLPARS